MDDGEWKGPSFGLPDYTSAQADGALALPAVVAFVFGYFAFRSRIKGVYFSIITQAMTYAAMLLFFRNETGFGGNNGFTGFTRILGFDITAQSTRAALFFATVVLLVGSLYLGFRLARSSSAGCSRPCVTPRTA